MADNTMKENPLLKTLLAQGADTAMTFRGYVGPSTRKGYVRLYPRLADLSQSIEVAEADILHSIEEPKSAFGSRVIYVKKDADIVVHRVDTPGVARDAGPQAETRELQRGRLRIRVRLRADDDTCASLCSCETCQCTCASFLPVPTLRTK
jgi:hypothetical protein